jgi:cell division protein FtsB
MSRRKPLNDPYGRPPPHSYPGDHPQAPEGYGYAQPPPYQYQIPQPERRNSWHIEKGISLSLLIFLVIQTASIVWFAAGISGQVKQNTTDIASLQLEEKEREKQRAEVIANLSSINQELRDMREMMIQSAGRSTTQLVMPSSPNGAAPTINIQGPNTTEPLKQ